MVAQQVLVKCQSNGDLVEKKIVELMGYLRFLAKMYCKQTFRKFL